MKNKTKHVVSLASILAVTAGVGAYSTFAWFTTTRTATVNVTSATVYSSYGRLLVSYPTAQPVQGTSYSVTEGSADADGDKPVTAIDATTIVNNETDISGSGKIGEFYKPTWIPGKELSEASVMNTVTNSATAPATSYYIAFNLKFFNKGTSSINVYFNNTTALTEKNKVDATTYSGYTTEQKAVYDTQIAKDTAAVNATRLAVCTTTTADSKVPDAIHNVWQQKTDGAYNYVTTAAAGTKLYTVDQRTLGDATTLTGWHAGAFANQVQKDFEPEAGQLICTLAAGANATLQFTSWIEGTTTAATNNAIGGQVSLALNFAALEA